MTSQADIELMRRAARAAGIKLAWWDSARSAFRVQDESMALTGGSRWNPLADGGDTFRLQILCGLRVEARKTFGRYEFTGGVKKTLSEPHYEVRAGECLETAKTLLALTVAARRAVVRAAASFDPVSSTTAPQGQKATP